MDLVIKNGTIVTASDTYKSDIGVKNGKIAGIWKGFEGEKVIDAKGMFVFPGGVDVHTHLDMPFMGTSSSDDFATGTIAAAFGGTTSLVDFAIQQHGDSLSQTLADWKKKAEGKASIDYGFHIAVTDVNDSIIKEMGTMVEEGVTSFKLFLAYKGSLMVDDAAIFRILERSREIGALVMVHAENGHLIDILTKQLLSEGKSAPLYHAEAHPVIAEKEAVERAIALAEAASAPLYIVHTSCDDALKGIKQAREKGLPVYAETCPQYLFLDDEKYKEPNFGGAKYVMSPPIRAKRNQNALWKGIKTGDFQVISTDHCPFFMKGQKDMGKDDWSKIPNGCPGIETRIPLMYSEGVVKGRMSINKFVEICSANPAKLLGLYPMKGTIAPGSDADLVIFDPEKKVTLSYKNLHQNVDYTPYEGMVVKGYPVKVVVNGELKVDDGKFVGKRGTGKFIKRNRFEG
ncbi:MAG: dihydropyrimidinase [Epsilonproteobacteria bacterium]|nr:dihydropyrimidinase [Campylobacterota bacterium]